ncbi:hypothetical protein [uncultured Roseovarius sp.]|uniref:hypothetical protein n=1 Tax=uncultured Roseovarius sp. TaxID=293344 RepID=UPI0025971961|nr:hypothetical protein [uncultured Roseovarius sp.]
MNWVTERVSNRVWTISLGVLAASLAYIVESTKPEGAAFLLPRQVVGPATLALLALIFDLIQYAAAHRQNFELLQKIEKEDLSAASYQTDDPMMKLRTYAHRLKFWFCIAAALWLVFVSSQRAIELI